MEKLLLLSLLTVAAARSVTIRNWDEWKAIHGKFYEDGEELKRRYIWEQNLKRVIAHNAEADLGLHSHRLGMNFFADMDEMEWKDHVRSHVTSRSSGVCNTTHGSYYSDFDVRSVDWRKKGAVTPVKHQGSLGNSWTFSATGALEGLNFIKTGKLVSLSEQNLDDCATPVFSPMCEVGSVECAFYYVMKNNGIDTEEAYPNTEHPSGECHYTVAGRGATCHGCVSLPRGDEEALSEAVATVGPVSVAIDAGHPSFQLYEEGIYFEPNCSEAQLDHAVLVVGYGDSSKDSYWIVKNQWGENWGEKGFIRMARNRDNNCGIATRASYPLM